MSGREALYNSSGDDLTNKHLQMKFKSPQHQTLSVANLDKKQRSTSWYQ